MPKPKPDLTDQAPCQTCTEHDGEPYFLAHGQEDVHRAAGHIVPPLTVTLNPLDIAELSNQARLNSGCVCDSSCDSCGRLADAFVAMREAFNELDANCENRQDEPFIAYVRKTARAALAKAARVKGGA